MSLLRIDVDIKEGYEQDIVLVDVYLFGLHIGHRREAINIKD